MERLASNRDRDFTAILAISRSAILREREEVAARHSGNAGDRDGGMWIRGRISDWCFATSAMLLGKDGAFLFIVGKGEGDGNEDEDGTRSEGGGVWESIS
ncbi:hypothetical protein TIFTF001_021781 [Ficus carica]|uniref:Uncharacterized protein n=1 Tax=Ficus carica TaxID=3494 RepID=A0AA88AHD4_FICCA|nr:hypothetical protein TIFTF001_021781 [Ficus carica]